MIHEHILSILEKRGFYLYQTHPKTCEYRSKNYESKSNSRFNVLFGDFESNPLLLGELNRRISPNMEVFIIREDARPKGESDFAFTRV